MSILNKNFVFEMISSKFLSWFNFGRFEHVAGADVHFWDISVQPARWSGDHQPTGCHGGASGLANLGGGGAAGHRHRLAVPVRAGDIPTRLPTCPLAILPRVTPLPPHHKTTRSKCQVCYSLLALLEQAKPALQHPASNGQILMTANFPKYSSPWI